MDESERSEIEKQAKFRTEVLKDLQSEKEAIDKLGDRVTALERTVTLGNGHPSLTAQVAELKTKMDELGEDVSKLGAMKEDIVEIKTTLSMQKERNTGWWQVAVVLGGIVLTAVLQYLLK